MSFSLSEIAAWVEGKVIGDPDLKITQLSTIDNILPNSLTFAQDKSKLKIVEASDALAIIVNESVTSSNKALIQVKNPLKAFISIINHYFPTQKNSAEIHPSAVIAEDCKMGKNVSIGAFCVVESGVSIGDNTVLKSHVFVGKNVVIENETTIHSHVTLYDNSQIGSFVTIHASTVVGSDGFGYTFSDGQHLKIPHKGKVIIRDGVEIGANSAIDRATLGATEIGEGTKIDNFVQIAHSVKLGKHNILCAFTGVAGSSTSGNNVIFAANVGISDHVTIGDNVILGARSGVPSNKHLNSDMVYIGSPARPKELAIKHELAVNRIPLIRKNIKTLAEKIDRLNLILTKLEKEKS